MNQAVNPSMTQAPTPVTIKMYQSAIGQWSHIQDAKHLHGVVKGVRAKSDIKHTFYNQMTT